MPKRLLLLRHAKSSWDDDQLPDHERPLNERGKEDALKVGKLLRRSQRVPDLIISSTARRARKTAQRVAEAARHTHSVLLYPELYSAPPERIMDTLRGVPGTPAVLLVVGHNPGLEDLVSNLTGQPITLPTAALADLWLPVDGWQELSFGIPAQLNELWLPKTDEPTAAP